MQMDRRWLLQSLPSFLAASSFPYLTEPARAAAAQDSAALLIPKSGASAALGRSMERAALLAQGVTPGKNLIVIDSGDTATSAALAARAARKAGVKVVMGPVFTAQVRSVLAVVGPSVPVLTFSNDATLLDSGAFLLGLTAQQSVASVLSYAAGRGVRRVAVGGAAEGWGGQVRAAVAQNAAALGLIADAWPTNIGSVLPGVSGTAGDGLPDAVLMPSLAEAIAIAPLLKVQGIQLLGAFQGLNPDGNSLQALEGAWLSAPDPVRYARFADAFEGRNGAWPGIITALAYDAAGITAQLRRSGGMDRSALLVGSGFTAVCGDVRFRENGSATRSLAILAVIDAALRTVAAPTAR